jgi:23S rRNA (guanosine2251-2'-O)-methyltransferase
MKVTLVLDNLRSVYNVGSIFRTANACGVNHIILCGTTPTPLDKKGEKRSDFAKVALGAEETISWEYVESTSEKIKQLKEEGYYVIAVEQDEKSVDYKNVSVEGKERVAFIIGGEVTGMSRQDLDMCDVIAEIKMLGTKESLNVTIAIGIALYRILGI